jgi:hypothetical protein
LIETICFGKAEKHVSETGCDCDLDGRRRCAGTQSGDSRGDDPDAVDSVISMAFGNLALDLLLKGVHGRLVVLKNGRYDNMPLDVITATKKFVNANQLYDTLRYRPKYENFEMKPLFIMTSEG